MLKKMNPVLPSRTAKSKPSPEGSFWITSCLRDARSAAGKLKPEALPPAGINAIDPGSALRNSSLKTKIGKNELAATVNCSVVGLPGTEPIPFN